MIVLNAGDLARKCNADSRNTPQAPFLDLSCYSNSSLYGTCPSVQRDKPHRLPSFGAQQEPGYCKHVILWVFRRAHQQRHREIVHAYLTDSPRVVDKMWIGAADETAICQSGPPPPSVTSPSSTYCSGELGRPSRRSTEKATRTSLEPGSTLCGRAERSGRTVCQCDF